MSCSTSWMTFIKAFRSSLLRSSDPSFTLILFMNSYSFTFFILVLLKFSSKAALFTALPSFPRIMNSFPVLFLNLQKQPSWQLWTFFSSNFLYKPWEVVFCTLIYLLFFKLCLQKYFLTLSQSQKISHTYHSSHDAFFPEELDPVCEIKYDFSTISLWFLH